MFVTSVYYQKLWMIRSIETLLEKRVKKSKGIKKRGKSYLAYHNNLYLLVNQLYIYIYIHVIRNNYKYKSVMNDLGCRVHHLL